MLDPGTALAVAGLAIDVSKELLGFFKAWKSCPEDALALRAALLWLSQTFHLVHKTLLNYKSLRHGAEATYDTVITSVDNCKFMVEALKNEVDKVQIERRKDAWEKIKNELKRFRYFFSKETISNMLVTINQCEGSLNVTISLLNLGTIANVLDEVRSLSTAFDTVAQARDVYLKAEFKNLKDLLSQQETQLDLSRELVLVLKDNDHKQALAWLVPLERQRTISRFHTTLYRSREFGTGSWFTNGNTFQRWQEESNTCLWLKGSVGSGKSVLCSTIIHDLQQRCHIRADDEHGDVLIYHYFSHTEEFLQHSEPMLRSCIAQAGFHGSVKFLLVEYYAKYNTTFMSEEPSLNEMVAFLSMLLKALSGPDQIEDIRSGGSVFPRQIFFVLDALDEIPFGNQRDEVLKFLQHVRNLQHPNLHLLLTSREGAAEKDIADVLEQGSTESEADQDNHSDDGESALIQPPSTAPLQSQLIKYVVTAENVKTDIELVVRKELRIHRRLKTLQLQAKEEILDQLVRLGQLNFREVALQITKLTSAELSNDTTPEVILNILGRPSNEIGSLFSDIEAVPYRLDVLYQQLLDSVPLTLVGMVSTALQWLLHSRRSLSLEEFIDICAFRKDDTGNLAFFEPQRRSPHELLAIFTGLVIVRNISFPIQPNNTSESRVSLAHISVKEFLTREKARTNLGHMYDPLPAHQLIADCCIKYLMHSNFLDKRHEQYALRNYAWNYWGWHCVRTRPLDSTSSIIEHEINSYAARTNDVSNSETELYLSRMLWALVGIQPLGNSKELATRLAFPYFYAEIHAGAVPNLEICNDKRISYFHSTLQDPTHQARLVELLATDDDSSELRANLEIVGNIQERSYEVVTYMWNPNSQPSMLRINGMPYGIPAGLEHVLKRLRGSGTKQRPRTLWIDAVSIDQNNFQEKSIMVERLPDFIKHSASHAIFADTSARQNDGQALELIKEIDRIQARNSGSEIERRQNLSDLINKHPVESLLRSLFNRRIWTRIWPLQEMVLSQNSTLFYGENQISTEVLERVLLQHEILESVLISGQRTIASDLVKDRTWRSAVEMVCIRAEIQQEHGVLPLRALYASRYLQCHNPRDRIYGLLCLLRDNSMSRLRVDYSYPSEWVFVKFSLIIIARYRNLDIFSLNSHTVPQSAFSEPVNDLPSWVSTFTVEKRETWPLVTSSFTYPVVDDVFKACGQQDQVKTISEAGEFIKFDLLLDGYIVDHVLSIYPQLDNPTIVNVTAQRRSIFSDTGLIASCTELLGPGETLISAYWRTMCANQSSIGELIPSTGQLGDRKFIPTDKEQESQWNSEDDQSIALGFSENRSFFISAAGRLGLAPFTAVEGDCVAICAGGKVPYILRHTDDSRYILIGDSYVHGIMDGEAVRMQNSKIQTLTIA